MRAISLWQPWATAVAIGVKKIETRHWCPTYRGPLAIHAAKRWDKSQRDFAGVELALGRLPKRIPFGAVIAICDLVDVRRVEDIEARGLDPIEKLYGNYSTGRFGWILADVVELTEPIPFKGHQSFFDVPDNLLPLTMQQHRDNREIHGHFGAGHS